MYWSRRCWRREVAGMWSFIKADVRYGAARQCCVKRPRRRHDGASAKIAARRRRHDGASARMGRKDLWKCARPTHAFFGVHGRVRSQSGPCGTVIQIHAHWQSRLALARAPGTFEARCGTGPSQVQHGHPRGGFTGKSTVRWVAPLCWEAQRTVEWLETDRYLLAQ